ncbi:MAG: hypothetical protein AB3N13_14550, partial [Arenibacterium sp.]
MKTTLSLGLALAMSATLAHADAMQTSMVNYVNDSIREMINFDAAHNAVKASNAALAAIRLRLVQRIHPNATISIVVATAAISLTNFRLRTRCTTSSSDVNS